MVPAVVCKLGSRGHRLCARQEVTRGLCLSSEEACKDRKVALARGQNPPADLTALLGNPEDCRGSSPGTSNHSSSVEGP